MSSFEKKYSRESAFLPQEIWMQTGTIDLPHRFGEDNDSMPRPSIFIDCSEGLIEIWMNTASHDWLVAGAARTVGTDLQKTQKIKEAYQTQLKELHLLWKEPVHSATDLLRVLPKMRLALANLHTLFYIITSEESLQEARDTAMGVRNEDRFFVEAEEYVVSALESLLPGRKDLVPFVLMKDLKQGFAMEELESRKAKFLFMDGDPKGPLSLAEYIAIHPDIKLIDASAQAAVAGEIKGRAAHPGIVQGKVRIVKKKEHAALVEDGDIIVSPMTTPDYLVAMKKAAAFVTDEGGITCHAAIVSRELGKPCVIGTKIATKVLKDGDQVEVDATIGLVRLIS